MVSSTELDVQLVGNVEGEVSPKTYTLMAITMPFWQWPFCPQYNHIGSVLLIMMVHTGISVASWDIGMNPELMPGVSGLDSLIGWHGLSKVDCATEWFCPTPIFVRLPTSDAYMQIKR